MSEARASRRDHGNITAQDVADRAGVSLTTVSRSFSDAGLVNEATRERVLSVAGRLGYRPNMAARVLAGRRSNLIGLLVNNFDDPEHLDLFRFVSSEAQQRNYHAILLNVSHERSEIASVDTALQYQVDGLLVAASHLPDQLAQSCEAQKKPIVVVGRRSLRPEYSSVHCDNHAGAALVADFMHEGGVIRPAFIGGNADATVTKERMAGFVQRIEELYGYQPVTRLAGVNDYDRGHAAALELMNLPKPPDGFFCSSDLLAVAAQDAVNPRGGQDSPDPMVVGFGQSLLARLNAYDLHSVSMPFEKMVRSATSLLINQIECGSTENTEISLPCDKIE